MKNLKPRSKKLNPKVDFTAMINISFLLIIFFMVVIELKKPTFIELGLPNTCCIEEAIICGPRSDRIITLLLDKNDKIIRYQGILEYPDKKPKVFNYGKNDIRKELIFINNEIKRVINFENQGAIVIIKPSKESNFGNLVAILDEMAITSIASFSIINDFTPSEIQLLASN